MNYYSLAIADARLDTYVLFDDISESKTKRRRSTELAPQVSALLGTPTVGLVIKPQYRSLLCKQCGRYDSDDAFDVGFDGESKVRIVGDFGVSNDRILLFRDTMLQVLKSAKVDGYQSKSVGKNWSAVRISRFVDSAPEVIEKSGPECSDCGRPEHAWGRHRRLTQLKVPSKGNTLFTTKIGSAARPFLDREIFMTEDVMTLLRDASIKGGYCYRLWSKEEADAYDEGLRKGKDKRPAGTTIYLNGKPPKKK